MKIGLDYDGTFTRDPTLWCHFLGMCRAKGYDVRIITLRSPGNQIDWMGLAEGYWVPVIYTDHMQKREYCDKINWHPDVWIDDTPEFIVRQDFLGFVKAMIETPTTPEELKGGSDGSKRDNT